MRKYKIAIIGGGNVGRTLAVKFDALGHNVSMIESRKPRTIRIGEYLMYNIVGDFGEHSQLVRVLDGYDQLEKDYDMIFVCTKLFDGTNVLRKIRSNIKSSGAIVTIQNMCWIDRASSVIPSQNAVYMQMDFSCFTTNDTTQVIDQDGVKLGIISKDAFDQLQMTADLFKDVCKVEQEKDIVGFILSRNIINIAISLLGAISGRSLGKILGDRHGRKLFVEIIRDCIRLFDTLNINILPYNDQLNYYLFVKNCRQGCAYRKRILKILKRNNSRVKSSILFDLERNAKSELLAVVKSFIKHAQIKRIKIPYIVTIYNMINEIIVGNRRIELNAFTDKKFKNIGEKL